MKHVLSENAYLRPLTKADAEELHALIEANRERLRRWLSWAAAQTFDDTLAFLRRWVRGPGRAPEGASS